MWLGLLSWFRDFTGSALYLAKDYKISWASLVAQLIKNPPAMWETLLRFLDWEDPLEKGWATHSSILGLSWWFIW